MDSQPSQSGRSFGAESRNNGKTKSPQGSSKNSSAFVRSISDASSQSLSSILNNPQVGKSGVYGSDASWVGWWSSSTAVAAPEFAPLGVTPKPGSEISRSDFQPYLSTVAHHLNRFEDIRNHTTKESLDLEDSIDGGAQGQAQGEALVACLREVPALYFKEDFELEDGATFRAACPFPVVPDNIELQEKLSQYLDTVELHLVKEISLRSNSFFEAQRQLQELNVKIVEGCQGIRELKETVRLVDADVVDSARQIQELNVTRNNLITLQQKLRLILDVNQALSALKLLIASADCAGALDITDDLQHLLDGDELAGLHCFRHLRDHVATSIDSINSILSAEFMHASRHGVGDVDAQILLRAKARATLQTNGKDDEVKLEDEEASQFRDRLLPLVIGFLRTAKLPTVLRMYRDGLTTDMKTAIKTMVAELLPVLVARPLESDFTPGERMVDTEGGGSSLASKLRSLMPESFVQLLEAIFKIVMVHLMKAAEVKKAIEWIMCNLDGHYAADSVAAAITLGAAARETQEADGQVSFLMHSPQKSTSKIPSIQAKGNDVSNPSNMSRNFRADILRENTEAVFAACDAAHGRWAKLLGVRATLHHRLRLQEFLALYNISQEFISSTEKIGGRLGYSIRGTLQSQAKAFVDFQHESRMAKLKAVLDQETWVEVDVPEEFRTILSTLLSAEPSINGDIDDVSESNETGNNDSSTLVDTEFSNSQKHVEQKKSTEPSSDNSKQAISASTETADNNRVSVVPSAMSNHKHKMERGKSSQAILFRGAGYHMVNCGLILLKMVSEYIEMNNFLPALSSEVVHRVVQVLKFFNTRTCQLVLGAGAMQVSGLRSITSKHLALASQVISFIYAVIPDIKKVLFLKVPEIRKALLLLEIDRVAQDYKVHRDEIHTKLVQIMRERLLVHLRGLPQIVESWNRHEDTELQLSQFARSLTKEVTYLQRVLSRTLHEVDVKEIFRQVVMIFHTQISEAFSRLEISTPQAKNRLSRDVQHILACIRLLPSGNLGKCDIPNWGQLDEFFLQRFGSEENVK